MQTAQDVVQEAQQQAQNAQQEMIRQAELQQQLSDWNLPGGWTAPPEDVPDDVLLPLQAGEWERSFTSTEPSIPIIEVEREARSGVYATDGLSLDVYVSRIPLEERDAVFDQIEVTISETSNGHSTVGSDDGTTRTFFFQTWGGQGSGWLVWNGGWLFFIHTDDPNLPVGEFMTAYFTAVDGPSLSPFTEVICQPDDTVLVRIDDEEQMLQLVSIDAVPTGEIIAACRNNYGELWEKRFVEDIGKVLVDMGHAPGSTVMLVLSDTETGETRTIDEAPMTRENRRRVYAERDQDE